MTTKQIRRPLFPANITIDSKNSARRFFKNNYKLIHSLKIDKYGSSHIIHELSCCKLLNIAQRIKYSSKLDLSKEERHMKSKESLNLKIVKKFKDIKILSVPLPYYLPESLVHTANWLKCAKRLKNLSIHEQLSKEAPVGLFKALLNRLKKTKLSNLMISMGNITPNLSKVLLTMKYFPSSLRNLSLSWNGSWSDPRDLYEKMDFHKGFSHLKELRSLKFSSPIKLKTLQKLLLTVPQPSNLVSLDLDITFDDDRDSDALLLLKEGLDGFVSLERLSLTFKNHMRTLRHLEFLQEYPIKHLQMNMVLNEEDILFQLGYALKIPDLQTLRLFIRGSFGCRITDAHFSLMSHISELTQLQELVFHVRTYYDPPKKIPGLLNAFSDFVEKQPHLNYLDFSHNQVDFHSESTKLLASLRQKAKRLTGLKLDFNNQSLNKSDVKSLLRVIEDAKLLEELSIDGFVFLEKEPLERLSKTLSMTKPLRAVSFDKIGGNLSVEAFENMTRNIIAKRGLEHFAANLTWTPTRHKKTKQFRGIDYSEILVSNPILKNVRIPTHFRLLNSDLQSCKWN